MNPRTLLISVPLLICLSACGGSGDRASAPVAEPEEASSADIGNHVVHFSAQTTDHLPPAVAREYNIVRSKNRAMLNVSVIRKSDNLPVTADRHTAGGRRHRVRPSAVVGEGLLTGIAPGQPDAGCGLVLSTRM